MKPSLIIVGTAEVHALALRASRQGRSGNRFCRSCAPVRGSCLSVCIASGFSRNFPDHAAATVSAGTIALQRGRGIGGPAAIVKSGRLR